MARLENNYVKAKHEYAEIGEIIRQCLQNMNNRLRGSIVIFETADSIEVMTDTVLLSKALCLIIDNAVQYGGTPAVIQIKFGKENVNSAFISISDNGCGIPEDQREVIFSKYTRFVREDRKNAGTGLGLAISRAIMKLLGGEIIAQDNPDSGGLFMLRFPLL
jgi:K+-sensing histidine kinase KdpD